MRLTASASYFCKFVVCSRSVRSLRKHLAHVHTQANKMFALLINIFVTRCFPRFQLVHIQVSKMLTLLINTFATRCFPRFQLVHIQASKMLALLINTFATMCFPRFQLATSANFGFSLLSRLSKDHANCLAIGVGEIKTG